jgi:hypothetical protein
MTFNDLYAQLPYETAFLAFLDCCHSGGMTRAGGAKVRGLNPPDDIRHRMLKWNRERELWEPRKLAQNANCPDTWKKRTPIQARAGASNRILRGVPLRALASDKKTRDMRNGART